ncbi:TM2 domain-containing membrane protein YozV, variant 2 [Balamuthia mandrillaris]
MRTRERRRTLRLFGGRGWSWTLFAALFCTLSCLCHATVNALVGQQPCTSAEDCPSHATCVKPAEDVAGECHCDEGYTNHEGTLDCDYQQKSKKSAFLLTFLLGPWGAGRFYLGYVGIGVAQLLISLFLCCLPCVPFCCLCCNFEDRRLASMLYGCMVCTLVTGTLTIWIWWLVVRLPVLPFIFLCPLLLPSCSGDLQHFCCRSFALLNVSLF